MHIPSTGAIRNRFEHHNYDVQIIYRNLLLRGFIMRNIYKHSILSLFLGLSCLAVACDDDGDSTTPDNNNNQTGYTVGQACPADFTSKCDGTKLVRCVDNIIVSDDCSATGICGHLEVDASPSCINTKYGQCSAVNAESAYCEDISNASVLRHLLCKRDLISNQMYYYAVPNSYTKCDYGCDSTDLTKCANQPVITPPDNQKDPDAIIAAFCTHNINECHSNDHASTYDACVQYENSQRTQFACDPQYQEDHLRYLEIITKQPCDDCTNSDFGQYASKAECDASWDDRLELLGILMEACIN